jgi:hypothetical protein
MYKGVVEGFSWGKPFAGEYKIKLENLTSHIFDGGERGATYPATISLNRSIEV